MSKSTTITHVASNGTTAVLAIPTRKALTKIKEVTEATGTVVRTYKIIGAEGTIPGLVKITDNRTKNTARFTLNITWPIARTESLTGETEDSDMETQFHIKVPLNMGVTGTQLRDTVGQTIAQLGFGSLVSNALSAVIYEGILQGATDLVG